MRSSFCNFGDCVEVEFEGERVDVMYSSKPGPTLFFSREEWSAFLAGVRNGEFDLPDQS